ncbi:facilitated trehalose transporter Tret1-like isoform X1 [Trichogramma pretiosum]|uniref:facilitated trehalose transporter Tret1-like isoform X1 n=1 Tax=Trichogramma pretiosum TaxID=7493 RepID=UPI0006C9669C|nr:facilitated trehalose transporter Tret1-like isoform X1 [Trichogramma pretiosum]
MASIRNYQTFPSSSTTELTRSGSSSDKSTVSLDDAEKAGLFDQNCNATIQPITNGIHKNLSTENKHKKGSPNRQILAALVAQLGTINTGLVFGFSAIALPQMKNLNSTSTIHVNQYEGSWIASMSAVGTPIGCLFSGYLMDILGRKLSLIVTQVPALLGWLLIFCASDVRMVYAGRFFTGLGSGMVGAPSRVYTSEVTQPHLRGTLTALGSVGVSTGVFIAYTLGAILSWDVCAGIMAILPAIALLLMFLFPETPSYLMSVNKPVEARESLHKFRSISYDLNEEIDTLANFNNKNNIKRLTGFKEIFTALIKPNALKPFILLNLYFVIYQWTGTNPMTFNAVEIVAMCGIQLNERWVAVLLGLIRLAVTIASCIACKKYGRRPMTFISSIGCGVTMLGLGSYLSMKNHLIGYEWISLICIIGYTITCTMGFLVVPWIMIGEIYPVQIRGVIGGLTTMINHIAVFSTVKTYPLLLDSLSNYGTFFLYGAVSIIGTVYFYIYLPETKHKSLQEIEDYFSGRNDSLKTGSLLARKTKVLEATKGQVLPM